MALRQRILFAFYPLYVKYNHGVALLSALCREAGIEPSLYLLDEVGKFREYLRQSAHMLIGFSCVAEEDYKRSLPFMQAARDMGCIVILGGVYARRTWITLESPAHWVCRGEGEFLPLYLKKAHWLDRPFEEEYLCPDLDGLPLPDYRLFQGIPFDRDFGFIRGKKVLPYHSSRGCPFNCVFCEVQGQPKKLRVRTKVEEDLREITGRYHPDVIYFGDELLPYYHSGWRDSWGENFTIPFIAYIRADIDPEHLEWLVDRGMIGCMFGVESGNEQYRNEVLQKDLVDAHLWRTIETLKQDGIHYGAFFITGAPGETFKMRLDTAAMIDKIQVLGGHTVVFQYENLFGGTR